MTTTTRPQIWLMKAADVKRYIAANFLGETARILLTENHVQRYILIEEVRMHDTLTDENTCYNTEEVRAFVGEKNMRKLETAVTTIMIEKRWSQALDERSIKSIKK